MPTFRLLTLFSFFMLLSVSSHAQDSLETKTSPHHLGIHRGAISGNGLSYRYWPSKWGIQITGLPVLYRNNNSFFSTGVSALYLIKDHEKLDLFAFGGNNIELDISPNTTNVSYNLGVGVGIKAQLSQSFNINLQGGYALKDIGSDIHTNIGLEAGIYYQF